MRIAPDGRRLVFVERFAPTSDRETTFTITAISVAGDTALRVVRPYRPKPVGRGVRDSLVAYVLQRFTARPPLAARRETIERGIREGLYAPAFYPPVSGLLIDTLGRIWIRREGLPRSAATWEVLDQAGTTVALVDAPHGAHVYAADGRFAWGVEYDGDGAPSLVRYRLVGPDRGAR
jgi:hypothetical protein